MYTNISVLKKTSCSQYAMIVKLFLLFTAYGTAQGTELKTIYGIQDIVLSSGAKKIADSSAAEGFCAHVKNTSVAWSIKCQVNSSKLENVPGYAAKSVYTAYVKVKVKYARENPKGIAFHYGMYTGSDSKKNFETAVSVKHINADNTWQVFEMGDFYSFDLKTLYVCGGDNVKNISDIYVEQFYFVPYEEKINKWLNGKNVYKFTGEDGYEVRMNLESTDIRADETEKIKLAVLKNGKLDKDSSVQLKLGENYLRTEQYGGEWQSELSSNTLGKQKLVIEINGQKQEIGNVYLNFAEPPAFSMKIISPTYNNSSLYLSHLPSRIRTGIEISAYIQNRKSLEMEVALEQNGKILYQEKTQRMPEKNFHIAIPLSPDVQAGELILSTRLFENGKEIQKSTQKLTVYPKMGNQVIIDENQNLIVDGKVFFPRSILPCGIADYDKIKAMGFNYVGCGDVGRTYRNPDEVIKLLDAAEKAGLKAVVGIAPLFSTLAEPYDPESAGKFINAIKNHPALLAWYHKDEPYGWWDELRSAYQTVKRLDPYHPVIMNEAPGPNWTGRGGQCCDLFMVDPYPVGTLNFASLTKSVPLTYVSDALSNASASVQYQKPLGAFLQAFQEGMLRMPTADEERCMTYLSIVKGAKIIAYFGAHQVLKLPPENKLRMEFSELNKELEELMPQLANARYLPETEIEIPDPEVQIGTWQSEKTLYLIIVNTAYHPKNIAVKIPSDFANTTYAEKVFSDSKSDISIKQGILKDNLHSLEVKIYQINSSAR